MDSKTLIRKMLQESLLGERGAPHADGIAGKKTTKYKKSDGAEKSSVVKKGEGSKGASKLDYSDIVAEFEKGVIKQVGIMKLMGKKDDKDGTERSLFGKKLHQEKNEDGSYYQFSEEEVNTIRTLLDLK